MWNRLIAFVNSHKWCAGVLLLLMPGSFFALPVWWLMRTFRRAGAARGVVQPPASAAHA